MLLRVDVVHPFVLTLEYRYSDRFRKIFITYYSLYSSWVKLCKRRGASSHAVYIKKVTVINGR